MCCGMTVAATDQDLVLPRSGPSLSCMLDPWRPCRQLLIFLSKVTFIQCGTIVAVADRNSSPHVSLSCTLDHWRPDQPLPTVMDFLRIYKKLFNHELMQRSTSLCLTASSLSWIFISLENMFSWTSSTFLLIFYLFFIFYGLRRGP
jgi:hypothetical protein